MELGFYKLHASTNDFVLVNCMHADAPTEERLPPLARMLCKRRTGVGANGVLFVLPGTEARLRIIALDPQGASFACLGDPLLCLGRYAFDSAFFDGGHLFVETSSGMVTIECIDSLNFRVPEARPRGWQEGSEVRETLDGEYVLDMIVKGRHVPVLPVDLGGRLAVHVANERRSTLQLLNAAMRTADGMVAALPVFVRLISRDRIQATAWPDGVPDFCRIAAGAAVAAIAAGFCDRLVEVGFRGTAYYVQWDEASSDVCVTGNADYSFSGTYYYDDDTFGI